jgi:hypothetical protein
MTLTRKNEGATARLSMRARIDKARRCGKCGAQKLAGTAQEAVSTPRTATTWIFSGADWGPAPLEIGPVFERSTKEIPQPVGLADLLIWSLCMVGS